MYWIVATRKQWTWLLLLSTAVFVAADTSIGEMVDEPSISATLKEVTELLEQDKADNNSILSATFVEKMAEVTNSVRNLESLAQRLSEKESKLYSILHTSNTRQMENLAERLDLLLNRETKLRKLKEGEIQKQKDLMEQQNNQSNQSLSSDPSATAEEPEDIITSRNLAQRLDTNVILGESEVAMAKWVSSLIEEEVGSYKKEIFGLASQVDATDTSSDTETDDCPSLTKIVQNVQQALNDHAEDGIGMVDLAQGASVVHWLTSKTHSPFNDRSGTLGSVWWNKFIPEDWERLLPSGWEKLEVGIPSYVYHSLGFLSGDVAPPEAVLQKNTLPGSCWPMEGSSGQIVLKLANPVVVESISVDHISSAIIPEGKTNSAPKKLKIIGYPPCDEMKSSCGAAGFDLSGPIDIANIEYDKEGPSVQTFESLYTKALASIPKPAFDANDMESGSCSVQTSCSTPPKISVAAIEVNVLENWGNPDFTCIYRLRVHGETEKM